MSRDNGIQNVTQQLIRDEGVVLHVYDDATGKPIGKGSAVVGYPTIGIGRMVDHGKGGGISMEEAEYLLANDIARRKRDLILTLPWFEELNEPRQGVLIGMAFQLGTGGLLKFKKALEFVRKAQYVAAANEMLNSTWAEQTPGRAERLAKQMMTGQWV